MMADTSSIAKTECSDEDGGRLSFSSSIDVSKAEEGRPQGEDGGERRTATACCNKDDIASTSNSTQHCSSTRTSKCCGNPDCQCGEECGGPDLCHCAASRLLDDLGRKEEDKVLTVTPVFMSDDDDGDEGGTAGVATIATATIIEVTGMRCNSCAMKIRAILVETLLSVRREGSMLDKKATVEGQVQVIFEEGEVRAVFQSDVERDAAMNAIRELGYGATLRKNREVGVQESTNEQHSKRKKKGGAWSVVIRDKEGISEAVHAAETRASFGVKTERATNSLTLNILGMTCSSCENGVRRALLGVDGVLTAKVSVATETAAITYDVETVGTDGIRGILQSVRDAGYDVDMSSADLVAILNSEGEEKEQEKEKGSNEAQLKTISFDVIGMTCANCSNTVIRALNSLEGVQSAKVSMSTERAVVEYDESVLRGQEGIEAILECVQDVGFDVDVEASDFDNNHHQDSPASGNNSDQRNESGVRREKQSREERRKNQVLKKRKAFFLSLLGTAPVLLFSMVLNYIPNQNIQAFLEMELHPGFTLLDLVLWIFTTPVQFGSGWPFHVGAYNGIRNRSLGMDVLISVGTNAAYIYAVTLIILGIKDGKSNGGSHFFETSAVLITFVLLGHWLQLRAMRKSSDALTKLMSLQSKTAVLVRPHVMEVKEPFNPEVHSYNEEVVPTDRLKKGDLIKIIRGASIPADGQIYQGQLTINEAMITGESLPVLKTLGADVLGGTICAEGVGFVRVTGVGSETALSQIVRLVEDAQMNKAPIQAFADTVSGIFVPIVVSLAFLTFVVWFSLAYTETIPIWWLKGQSPVTFAIVFALATLVISCPCALGLATPTAVMVGTGVGAKNGILIKGGEQLQKSSNVNVIIFDKTGTLTKGKPAVTDFVRLKENSNNGDAVQMDDLDLLWILGSLERNSEHPLAAAIVSYVERSIPKDKLEEKPFTEPTNFMAITGKGVSSEVGGTSVAVGNRPFYSQSGIDVPDEAEHVMVEMEVVGKTAVLAAVDGKIEAVIGISDEIKPDSEAAIAYLRRRGVDVWMVTGDNRRTAEAVANQLGLSLDRVIAQALPRTKLEKVKSLQDEGKIVGMIGDGINDSPALAQADVGISMGTGAEIATEASDMVLVNSNVVAVCVAIDLSRKIFNRIRMNFGWALFYNCLGIPIAMGVFYPAVQVTLPPMLAVIAMILSSLSVLTSSLSLKTYRPPDVLGTQQLPIQRLKGAVGVGSKSKSGTRKTRDLADVV